MGTVQSTTLNTDTDAKRTSSVYGDAGDGVSRWFQWRRTADGGDATAGAKADAAVTDPTSSGSIVALLKGILTANRLSAAGMLKAEDAAHASGDAGVMTFSVRQDTAAALAGTTGDYIPTTTDALGYMRTRDRDTEQAPANARTTALAASLVVKASAGRLYGLQGYATSAGFLQIHDASSLPADSVVPEEVFPIEANKPFSLDTGRRGIQYATGIVVCFSSTGPTKTIGGSVMWVSAQFE